MKSPLGSPHEIIYNLQIFRGVDYRSGREIPVEWNREPGHSQQQ